MICTQIQCPCIMHIPQSISKNYEVVQGRIFAATRAQPKQRHGTLRIASIQRPSLDAIRNVVELHCDERRIELLQQVAVNQKERLVQQRSSFYLQDPEVFFKCHNIARFWPGYAGFVHSGLQFRRKSVWCVLFSC